MNVVNVKHAQPGTYVYVGRRMPGREGSRWGNKFKDKRDGTRDEVIAKYRADLWQQIKDDPTALPALRALWGQLHTEHLDIGCWCAPLACHGEVLLRAMAWACTKVYWVEEAAK